MKIYHIYYFANIIFEALNLFLLPFYCTHSAARVIWFAIFSPHSYVNSQKNGCLISEWMKHLHASEFTKCKSK